MDPDFSKLYGSLDLNPTFDCRTAGPSYNQISIEMKYLVFSIIFVLLPGFTKTQADDFEHSKFKKQFSREVRMVKKESPNCSPSGKSFSFCFRKLDTPAKPGCLKIKTSGSRTTPAKKTDPYVLSIEEFRANYKKHFPKNEFAPLRTQSDFSKMRFFEPDSRYCFECSFEKAEDDGVHDMATTDSKTAPFVKYGWVTFNFKAAKHRLAVYKRLDFDFLFIPFRDLTNGESTYGGGRFLEFDRKTLVNGSVKIDFNKSYNPWCHYDPDLPCPVPPEGNKLKIPIPVGEKLYDMSRPHS